MEIQTWEPQSGLNSMRVRIGVPMSVTLTQMGVTPARPPGLALLIPSRVHMVQCYFRCTWQHFYSKNDEMVACFFAENQYVGVLWTFNLDHDDGSTSADGKTNQFSSWFRRRIFCIVKCSCKKTHWGKNSLKKTFKKPLKIEKYSLGNLWFKF